MPMVNVLFFRKESKSWDQNSQSLKDKDNDDVDARIGVFLINKNIDLFFIFGFLWSRNFAFFLSTNKKSSRLLAFSPIIKKMLILTHYTASSVVLFSF